MEVATVGLIHTRRGGNREGVALSRTQWAIPSKGWSARAVGQGYLLSEGFKLAVTLARRGTTARVGQEFNTKTFKWSRHDICAAIIGGLKKIPPTGDEGVPPRFTILERVVSEMTR